MDWECVAGESVEGGRRHFPFRGSCETALCVVLCVHGKTSVGSLGYTFPHL